MAKTKSATKGGSKRDKPPALDQYTKPLIGIALAMLAYQMFRGMVAKEIRRVDMTETANEMELREVFFGEETGNTNYAVLCYPESAVFPVSSVFQDAANDGGAPAQFRLMDCDAAIPGNKEGNSVVKRFGLNKKTRPVVFVSGAVGQPKQVPAKYLKTGAMLTKALKNLLEPKAEKIETTQDLRSKCLDKDICGLLLKGSKTSPKYAKEAMQKLVVEFPKVTFAAVDSSVLYVKGVEAEFLPELTQGIPRFIVFKKTSGGVKSDDGRLKTTAIALDKDTSYGPMSNLVGSVVSGSAEMAKVSTAPTIKTRTKKLEKTENEKRQRRLNREKGGSDSSSSDRGSSSSGGSGENDGSREGRRAERERRRAEHRKNNPDYKEKTPEELKEMERQRRIRMEEEAKKWNMSPEDEDGDGGADYMMDEDYDDEGEESLDDEDEDDEDVMDLD